MKYGTTPHNEIQGSATMFPRREPEAIPPVLLLCRVGLNERGEKVLKPLGVIMDGRSA